MQLAAEQIRRGPKSNAERSRKFRQLRRTREWAAAIAVARLASGRDLEELSKALAKWMEEVADRYESALPDPEPDSVEEIRTAAARLKRRR